MARLLLTIIFLSFISLGLPDAALGTAWPAMYPELDVSIGAAGMIALVVTAGTIVSSLLSGTILGRFGTGKVNFASTLLTGLALIGYARSPSYVWLLAFAIPLGLGAGSVDAGLNSYVAMHYKAHHMNWLHSFWGMGATLSPVILAQIISRTGNWRTGYQTIASIQLILAVVLFLSLPLWEKVGKKLASHPVQANIPETTTTAEGLALAEQEKTLSNTVLDKEQPSLLHLFKTPGLLLVLLSFFFYCGAEISMGLWGGSLMVNVHGLAVEQAGQYVASYFGGIMAGRFLTGFLTFRYKTHTLIRFGIFASLLGALLIFFIGATSGGQIGFILVGLGFAPVFPGMIHETPARFGQHHSQSIIGFQMASAYAGTMLFPPIIGSLATRFSLTVLMPVVILLILALVLSTETINRLFARKAAT
ncbi:MAG: MFS transporter [Clostridia bacterium]|nr:MFS transporter [Clostridia bacterium]